MKKLILIKNLQRKTNIMLNPLSATYNLKQTTISNFVAFSKITNKARCFMRMVCWQMILIKNHALFFRRSGKISSAAVVIGALRVKITQHAKLNCRSFVSEWHDAANH